MYGTLSHTGSLIGFGTLTSKGSLFPQGTLNSKGSLLLTGTLMINGFFSLYTRSSTFLESIEMVSSKPLNSVNAIRTMEVRKAFSAGSAA